MKKVVLILMFLGVALPLAWLLMIKYEGGAPEVDVRLPSLYLNNDYVIDLGVKDNRTGLRQVMVTLVQKGNEKTLLDKTYPSDSAFSLFTGPGLLEDAFAIPIDARKHGMEDGEAVIRILVSDKAWRGWNRGNTTFLEKKVVIDTQPPNLRILTSQHNIERGGSALIIYQVFEPEIQSGVKVGDNFFPGHSGLFKDPLIMASFFALDHTQGPGTRMTVQARDPAGNLTEKGFYHYIRDKDFRSDVLNISDEFLAFKMPDINTGAKEAEFQADKNPLLAKFLYVNSEFRKQNVDLVLSAPRDTVAQLLWQERFSRLPGSANKAKFADKRTYKYNGKEISRAVHLGIDLASTAHSPVEAANSGRVILAEDVGIFGNTVIIDHGFGLASLYSHLSEIQVTKGQTLAKGEVLGKTGMTGLAGGDHLHYSMLLHNIFVNPVEWWDPSWIQNNVTSKIQAVEKEISASGS